MTALTIPEAKPNGRTSSAPPGLHSVGRMRSTGSRPWLRSLALFGLIEIGPGGARDRSHGWSGAEPVEGGCVVNDQAPEGRGRFTRMTCRDQSNKYRSSNSTRCLRSNDRNSSSNGRPR
jgi:hypothetical protein